MIAATVSGPSRMIASSNGDGALDAVQEREGGGLQPARMKVGSRGPKPRQNGGMPVAAVVARVPPW